MEVKSVVCFSFSLAAGEPMAYIRLIAPLRHLGIHILDGFRRSGDISVEEAVSQGDLVIFQREFPIQFDVYQEAVEIAREQGKPVVLELDDLLFFLPEIHPDRQKHYYAFSLLPMLQALMEADAVIVPTTKMREVLRVYNSNIFVIPNYFDDSLWSFRPPVAPGLPHQQVTIGYMGTNSHQPDLEFVAPVLLNLLNQYSHLRVRFWGVQPPVQLRDHPHVEWVRCEYRSYEEFAKFFQTQSADIFIAPLADHLFNRCKSSLKFFEYSALGAPGVYSHLEPYSSVVQPGRSGMLAYSLDEWERCLVQLIENRELRFHLAVGAQATIRKKWLLSRNAHRWREAFQIILNSRRGKKRAANLPIQAMLAAINAQLFEAFQAFQALHAQVEQRDQMIQALHAQVEQRDQMIQALHAQVEELNHEILGYVLSRSWQITRPLRVIGRGIRKVVGGEK